MKSYHTPIQSETPPSHLCLLHWPAVCIGNHACNFTQLSGTGHNTGLGQLFGCGWFPPQGLMGPKKKAAEGGLGGTPRAPSPSDWRGGGNDIPPSTLLECRASFLSQLTLHNFHWCVYVACMCVTCGIICGIRHRPEGLVVSPKILFILNLAPNFGTKMNFPLLSFFWRCTPPFCTFSRGIILNTNQLLSIEKEEVSINAYLKHQNNYFLLFRKIKLFFLLSQKEIKI